MYNRNPKEKKKEVMESSDIDMSFSTIMKEVVRFGSSHMTWKDRKALENQRVTELGGKPQKKQRLPLSVARVQMKKQKEREEKMLENRSILGKFEGPLGVVTTKKPVERKRKPEERVLKSTEGNFRSGVLDVRHLLHSGSSRRSDRDNKTSSYGMDKNRGEGGGSGRKSKGKKKGSKKGKKKGGNKRKGK
ncbi:unnamed protein product [Microthlaspi erraticum]|uniref:Uncharacterized protein n=1 Tax=Microthlaspi erraticum TaxID=1685480 RepID=A0A6D2KNJ4_9BRAS|nr:unnamed protein product [Microthlaspi erraticum]